MAYNLKEITENIVKELQNIAFANIDDNPHIKINQKLTAIKELISLLNLKEVAAAVGDAHRGVPSDHGRPSDPATSSVGANIVRPQTPTTPQPPFAKGGAAAAAGDFPGRPIESFPVTDKMVDNFFKSMGINLDEMPKDEPVVLNREQRRKMKKSCAFLQ